MAEGLEMETAALPGAKDALPPPAPKPPDRPRARGWWPGVVALGRYLSQTEVHTYAFSVAANTILSIFPFIVMMFTVAQDVFHSPAMAREIGSILIDVLP